MEQKKKHPVGRGWKVADGQAEPGGWKHMDPREQGCSAHCAEGKNVGAGGAADVTSHGWKGCGRPMGHWV